MNTLYLRRHWPNRLPVLAKSPTSIDQIAFRYSQNRKLVHLGRIIFFVQEISFIIPHRFTK